MAQFEAEGRGPAWVQNGTLMIRTKGQTYSPNYPGGPPRADAEADEMHWSVSGGVPEL